MTTKSKVPAFKLSTPIPKTKVKTSLEGVVGSRVNAKDYDGNGHWHFDTIMGDRSKIGFIYIIRNNVSGRCYIGRKNYRGKGKGNKGLRSNWPWYITSSNELSKDIKLLGKDSFEFICIEEYSTLGALGWAETYSICFVEAPSNQHMWYNRDISAVRWVVKEPITDKHKLTLQALIERYKNELKDKDID